MADKPIVYLLDISGFIHRAYYSRPPLAATDNQPCNAVVGYLEMIAHLMEYAPAGTVFGAVCDTNRPTWRHRLFNKYKATRAPRPIELSSQFIPVFAATDALGIPRLEAEGFEADDVLATYSAEALRRGHNVVIVSSDKDLMQLVDDAAQVAMFDPMKKVLITEEGVRARHGVHPRRLADVLALAGDKVDNVPGVPMIGPKIAAELVNRFGDVEDVILNWQQITGSRGALVWEHRENAKLSKELVVLRDDAPMEVPFERLCPFAPDPGKLRKFLDWIGRGYTPKRMERYL